MAYIPKQHEKYDLLPSRKKHGGEVFQYPTKLISKIDKIVGGKIALFEPYGYGSYDEYFDYLDEKAETYKENSELVGLILTLKERVKEMNVKEDWSVLRYIGPKREGHYDLTCGRAYYWPTTKNDPVYQGVVDNEEFTAYSYPTEASLWEILEDPTGMAYRTIYKNDEGGLSIKEHDCVMEQLKKMKVED